MNRHRLILTSVLLAVSAATLCGCVQSEASRYRRTVGSSVAPDRRVSADVASAFGLREEAPGTAALAAVDE